MKKLVLSSALLLSLNLSAQNKINVAPFTTLQISSSVDVKLVQGTENYIQINDNEYNTANVVSKVEGGVLIVSFAEGKRPSGDIQISCQNLERLDISGSGEIETEGMLNAKNFTINKSGSGELDLKLNSNVIVANLSGSGEVELEGAAKNLTVNKSGSGTFKSYQLMSNKVKANVSGAGTVKVYASDTLIANASGIGDILYVGKPKTVEVNISGAGTVREVPFVEKSNADTTKLKFGGKRIIILDDDDENEVAKNDTTPKKYSVKDIYKGFEIGVNGYTTNTNSFTVDKSYDYLNLNYGKSININLNFAEYHIRLYKNNVVLTTGAGFEFNRYFFSKGNMSLLPTKDTVSASMFAVNFKKNILKASYVTVPLLLQFNTNQNSDKAFHFAVGGYFGYNLGSQLKQLYTVGGTDYKLKTEDNNNFNLNPFKYGAMVRMGYKKVNVYATYAMSELFQAKTFGPVLHPFSIGFTLIPF